MNDVLRMLNDRGVTVAELRLTPEYLAQIIQLVDAGTINTSTGKLLLQKVDETRRPPQEIVQSEGLARVNDDTAIRDICQQVLAENPKEVASYKAGKLTLAAWFVGQVMRKMRGKADPSLARTILDELLNR